MKKVLIIIGVIVFCIIVYLFFIMLHIKQTDNIIKTSDINTYCSSINECDLKDIMKKKISSKMKYSINGDTTYVSGKKKYQIKVKQFFVTKNFEFTIKDNLGPIINADSISIKVGEELDLKKYIQINDYSDGKISLDNSNVEIKMNDFNKNVIDTYIINIKVTDADGNVSEEKIKVKVNPIAVEKIVLNAPKKITVGEKVKISYKIYPDNATNKEVYFSGDDDMKIYQEKNNTYISVSKAGQYELYIKSKENRDIYDSVQIEASMSCKNKYVFNFDGGTNITLNEGEDFCIGKYKIYIQTVNKSWLDCMNIYSNNDTNSWQYICYNDNGKKAFKFNSGAHIEVEPPITKVTLIKQ